MSVDGRHGGTRGPGSGMATAFAPAAIVVAVIVGLVWVTGTVGGLLTHRQRPHATLSDMGAVAVRLVRHPGEPAAAWPAPDQRLIPGPAGFYATLLGVACLAGGLAILGWRGWRRVEAVLPGSDDYGAAWATRGDLRDLAVRKRTDLTGRIVLGRTTWRQTIASTLRHSLLLFGPTLSGKTTSFVIPTVLRWRGPVIATSSKVDMLLATIKRRKQRGRTYLLDPFRASGLDAIRWSPLVGCAHWADALDMAYWLTQAASVSHSVQSAEFWETLAKNLLGPLLYAAANMPGATMLTVVAWANEYDRADDVLAVFTAMEQRDPDDPGPRLARSAFVASVKADPRRKDSIYGTAQVLLDVYKYPAVADTARGCDIDRDQFLQGVDHHGQPTDNTVIVFAPEHRHAHTGQPLDPPLLLMLDEAANIAPLRRLDTYASTLASQGVQLVAVFQDLAQVRRCYGNQANTILTNFLTKILMAGTTDRELLDLLTHLLGKQHTLQQSTTHSPDGSRTTTAATRHHDLAPPHTLVQQPPGHALALLSHRPPVRVRVRPDIEGG